MRKKRQFGDPEEALMFCIDLRKKGAKEVRMCTLVEYEL